MKGHETGQKTTIESAAKQLAVSTKTIQRYIAKGVLTKIKQGNRTYLLVSELAKLDQTLCMRQETDQQGQNSELWTSRPRDTVTIDLARYERLLIELGELRKRNVLLDEYRAALQLHEEAIEDVRKQIEQLDGRLKTVESAKLEKEKLSVPHATHSGDSTKPSQKPWWQK